MPVLILNHKAHRYPYYWRGIKAFLAHDQGFQLCRSLHYLHYANQKCWLEVYNSNRPMPHIQIEFDHIKVRYEDDPDNQDETLT